MSEPPLARLKIFLRGKTKLISTYASIFPGSCCGRWQQTAPDIRLAGTQGLGYGIQNGSHRSWEVEEAVGWPLEGGTVGPGLEWGSWGPTACGASQSLTCLQPGTATRFTHSSSSVQTSGLGYLSSPGTSAGQSTCQPAWIRIWGWRPEGGPSCCREPCHKGLGAPLGVTYPGDRGQD